MEEIYMFYYAVIPPIIVGLGIIVLIVVIGQIIKARVSAVGKRSFEKLANELREDNAKMMIELMVMKENLSAIHKMLKEIE